MEYCYIRVFGKRIKDGHYAHTLYMEAGATAESVPTLCPTERKASAIPYPPLLFSLIPLAKLIDAPLESEG